MCIGAGAARLGRSGHPMRRLHQPTGNDLLDYIICLSCCCCCCCSEESLLYYLHFILFHFWEVKGKTDKARHVFLSDSPAVEFACLSRRLVTLARNVRLCQRNALSPYTTNKAHIIIFRGNAAGLFLVYFQCTRIAAKMTSRSSSWII